MAISVEAAKYLELNPRYIREQALKQATTPDVIEPVEAFMLNPVTKVAFEMQLHVDFALAEARLVRGELPPEDAHYIADIARQDYLNRVQKDLPVYQID